MNNYSITGQLIQYSTFKKLLDHLVEGELKKDYCKSETCNLPFCSCVMDFFGRQVNIIKKYLFNYPHIFCMYIVCTI